MSTLEEAQHQASLEIERLLKEELTPRLLAYLATRAPLRGMNEEIASRHAKPSGIPAAFVKIDPLT